MRVHYVCHFEGSGYIYDDTKPLCLTTHVPWGEEEEGSYEYAADQQGAENGKSEAHIEPAVLYTPLGGNTSEDDGFDEDEWRRIFAEYGSRCEQYGGHWKGHRCVGVRHSGGGNAGDTCRTVAGVTAPLAAASGPGGWILWGIGFGTCELN